MGKLIDAEALRRETMSIECGEYIGEDVRDITVVFENDINNAPTVDAVEVCRCRECDQWHDGVCDTFSADTGPNFYCANGVHPAAQNTPESAGKAHRDADREAGEKS